MTADALSSVYHVIECTAHARAHARARPRLERLELDDPHTSITQDVKLFRFQLRATHARARLERLELDVPHVRALLPGHLGPVGEEQLAWERRGGDGGACVLGVVLDASCVCTEAFNRHDHAHLHTRTRMHARARTHALSSS